MQRRAHQGSTSASSPGGAKSNLPLASGGSGAGRKANKRGRSGGGGGLLGLAPLWAILILALVLMAISSWYVSPTTVSKLEDEAVALGRKALEAEQEFFHLNGQKQNQQYPPKQQGGNNNYNQDNTHYESATARMLAQDSTWVDGEKKLKAKLRELADRQQQGLDLGVPVLTRYLGEDIPAWVGEGVDEAEWRKQVDTRYAEMRKEEEEWKKRMQAIIDQRERDIGITTAR